MKSAVAATVAAAIAARDAVVHGLDLGQIVEGTRQLREFRGWLDAAEARLASRTNELCEQGSGVSSADLTVRIGGVSAAEARRRQRRSDTLESVTSFAEALGAGRVGAEHVDVLATIVGKLDDTTRTAVFGCERELLERAASLSPEKFARACRQLVQRVQRDQGVERAERQRAETRLSRRIDADGMHHLSGAFHPELGAAIWRALDLEIGALVARAEDRSADRQQLAGVALGNLVVGGHQAIRPVEAEISVIIDLDTMLNGLHDNSICEYTTGIELPPATVRQLACQGRIIPIVFNSHGVPIEIGRERRLATRPQRRALRAIYRSCVVPECECEFERCEIHHIIPFECGGLTNLDNLIPLCSRHHHMLHELGWILELDADRSLTIRQRDGTTYVTAPPPTLRPPSRRCQTPRTPTTNTSLQPASDTERSDNQHLATIS